MTHQSPKTHRDPPEPRLLDDGFLVEPEPPERVPWQGWERPVVTTRRRDLFLAAIAIALLAAIVALLASGAWERADATPSEATERNVSAVFGGTSHSPAQSLRGAPQLSDLGATPGRSEVVDSQATPANGDVTAGGPWARGAPPPGAVVSGREGGWATWCAPTPDYCQSWGDDAMVGAVQTFTFGDEPYLVRVHRGSRSVVVWVVSHCACGIREGKATVIDLSPAAFSQIAPLSAGRVLVELEDLRGQVVDDPPPHPADDAMRLEDRPLPATSTDTVP